MHFSVSLILLWDTDRLSFPSFYFIYITIIIILLLLLLSLFYESELRFRFGFVGQNSGSEDVNTCRHITTPKKKPKTKILRLKIAHWSLKLTNRSCNKFWQNCSFYGISTWSKAKCLHILEYLQKRKKKKKNGKLALVNNEVNLTSAKKIAKNWN